MGTVQAFVDAFNKGDLKAAVATCTPQAGVIDDFPPHEWMSCAAWADAFTAFGKQDGDTEMHITPGAPMHVDITKDVAYVVVPTTLSFQHKGSAVTRGGSIWTLILKNTSAGWRISAWAWADGK
jgi:ketosteroid isomerase-like protein